MLHDLFSIEIPVLDKVLRTVAVYLLVLLIFRFIGKRAMSAMNTMDFVLLFLLSNVVQNAIIGADNSLVGGTIGALTLVLANALIDKLALNSDLIRRLVVGTPTTVITDGHVQRRGLRRIGLRSGQLKTLLSEQNGVSVAEVKFAAMEPEGHLLVELKDRDEPATRSDVAALEARLDRIEALLTTRQ